jgi:lipopolysaccharide export system protein LptA
LFSAPGSATTTAPPPTNQVVEVRCDNYELRTNVAVFREQVRVSQRLGDQEQGQMTCGRMTLTLAGTNELEKMVAEQEVVIGQADRQFTAAKAEYTATNQVLDLIGNPAWRDGPREGKGDSIRANLARAEMLVQGNALMKLPAAEVGRATLTGLGAPPPGQVRQETPGPAEIHAREYLLTAEAALFQGGVRIEHPQMKWACEELTMLSQPELGKEGRMIIAEPAVVFELLDDQGRSYHGAGRKAVYTRRHTTALTNDLMELTGTPATLEATNIVIRNNVIALDLSNHKLVTPGKYNYHGAAPASATNFFRPRKSG